jgi:uncharacterized protein (TIGR03435 family)
MIPTKLILAALANHLWQSTLFVLAASLLALALRSNRAQTRHRIWVIASLKFLFPFSILVTAGGYLRGPVPVPAVHPALPAAVQQFGQPFTPLLPYASVTPAASDSIHWLPALLFAIWLGGAAAVTASWWKNWRRIRAVVRTAAPLAVHLPIPVVSSPSALEPGVFGIFRPVLVLPAGITGHLTPAHLEAILAHELCHARRRDNLTSALHMLVEAVFWFHPLVWWIGARMVDERERACDEEVLRLGARPGVYAEGILATCRFYFRSPLSCVSGVTGSGLKDRIARIMSGTKVTGLNTPKKLMLAAAGIAALALPLAIGLLSPSRSRAQSQSPDAEKPSFEAASIKPTKGGDVRTMLLIRPGGKVTAAGLTVKGLVMEAYDVKEAQISGAPAWFNFERYDIDAKPEDSAGAAMDKLPPEQRKRQLMLMLQSLLAERFQLVLGHEQKELPVYALVVAKNGPKLKKSAFVLPDKPPADPHFPKPGSPPPPGGIWMNGPGQLTSTGIGLPMFVNVLSRLAGRAVIDKTGLTGSYDFALQWTPEMGQGPMTPGGPGPGAGGPPPAEASGPSLFTALQEQLGLKLESEKAQMDVLVIEHVERPSEN